MTREEIIENLLVLAAYLKREYGKMFPQEYFDSISSAIEILSKPSLPYNLDEAAFNYAELCKYEDADKLLCAEHFKAGAEWMASRVQPEVDLEKEVKSYIKDNFTITDEVAQIPEEDRMYSMGQDDMVSFAKHVYEFGLKTRKEESREVGLDEFAEKIKTFQERYKHPEIVSIKGAMAFMARMFYQYPNVAREWYEQLPKATMD